VPVKRCVGRITRIERNKRMLMGQARSTAFLRFGLVCCVWAAIAGDVARAHVGVPLADVRRPSADWSIGAGSAQQRLLEAPCGLPTLCDTESGPCAPFNCPWHALQGPLSALERRLFADAADGRWDEHSLLSAALVASGVSDPEAIRRYENQVARLAAELAESGRIAGSPQEQAAALFELMHQKVLRGGYQIDATVLTRTLDEGRFNCVSASVLFNCLAGQFELSARGLEIPSHAMSRLILPDGPLDVETTCPGWFRLIGDPDKQAELVEKTLGRSPGRGSGPVEAREVSDVELVATIYYNRGVDLLGEKRFAAAVAANAKSLRLDPENTTARGNLLATINNWAVDLDVAGRPAEAIELLRRGLALDRDYETFKVNYVHAHGQWISQLIASGRRLEARRIARRAMADPFLAGQIDGAIPASLGK
jgi:tetratricopeptide (TPR) repeat protein